MTRVASKPPLGLKDRSEKPAKARRKQMRPVSRKVANRKASPEGLEDAAYMALVAQLPCVICEAFGEAQKSPTTVHHPIHGRYGTRKSPDSTTIPLCEGHHIGNFDTSKVAIHREPSKWKRFYGEDHEYTEVTRDRVERYFKIEPHGAVDT